jgi:uncharacterized protein YgbK (DUF1537 family)
MPEAGILVPDVSSSADLMRIAELTDESMLAAGAADYFQTLLQKTTQTRLASEPPAIELKPPAMLICGSRLTWPDRQKDCQKVPMPVVLASGMGSGPMHFSAFLLGIGDEEKADSSNALERLAGLSSIMIPGFDVQTVLMEGGATAAAVAQRLGWNRLAVVSTAPAGVGVLRPLGMQPTEEQSAAPLVLIKPGSYAWPEEIWSAFCALAFA